MAEFCRECFIRLLRPSEYDIKHIVMSDENCICECCGQYGPFVDHIYHPVFGIDWSDE